MYKRVNFWLYDSVAVTGKYMLNSILESILTTLSKEDYTMRIPTQFSILLMVGVVLFLPVLSQGQKLTTDKLQISLQPLSEEEFQAHLKFDIPDFEKLASEKTNIDYAVLEFDVQVMAVDSASVDILEVLLAAETENAPRSNLDYNTNPVTARVIRTKTGVQRVRVNLTQLLELWVRNKIANHGLLLVSHRRQVEKTLCSDKIILSVEPRPSIKIFYTELD